MLTSGDSSRFLSVSWDINGSVMGGGGLRRKRIESRLSVVLSQQAASRHRESEQGGLIQWGVGALRKYPSFPLLLAGPF